MARWHTRPPPVCALLWNLELWNSREIDGSDVCIFSRYQVFGLSLLCARSNNVMQSVTHVVDGIIQQAPPGQLQHVVRCMSASCSFGALVMGVGLANHIPKIFEGGFVNDFHWLLHATENSRATWIFGAKGCQPS